MNRLNKDIPLLLREKIGKDLKPENIVGYHYCIGYCISDWDFPVENYYYEEEECNIGEVLKINGIDKADDRYASSEQKYCEKVPDEPFVSQNRGHFSSFFAEGSCQWPTLYWAYIDIKYTCEQEDKTLRVKEHDRDSVANGDFEKLRLWLYNMVTQKK